MSPTTAGYWRTGERKPNAADRERLKERYGIPVEAWDEPPTKMGRPKAPRGGQNDAAPPAADSAPPPPPPPPPKDGGLDVDATLQSNAVRLNRMILADLAKLEDDDGDELEIGKRSEILKKLTDSQVALAKATGETTLTMQRIVVHPEFRRVVKLITDALAPHPDVLAKVLDVLKAAS